VTVHSSGHSPRILSMFSLSRRVVIAAVTVGAVVVSGVGVIGFQSYAALQSEAQAEMQESIGAGYEELALFLEQQGALALAIRNAGKILNDSEASTLDEVAREKLATAIAYTRTTLRQQQESSRQFASTLARAEQSPSDGFVWPPDELATAKSLRESLRGDSEALLRAVQYLGTSMGAVKAAQVAWQTEQDRIAEAAAAAAAAAAAEKAAAEATARIKARRTIAPISTVTGSGGATAPSAPAPPAAPIAPVAGFDIEGYISALAPNSYISWVDGLCDGYYVCGRAWVGGAKTTPVRIELDPALRDIYANRVGISVLVHEAAHARQWLFYGSDIISANEALTGITGAAAVEYMADCATIGKLGYSTGTYTSSCSADQLDAAALIW
jgi:hypothetical protein